MGDLGRRHPHDRGTVAGCRSAYRTVAQIAEGHLNAVRGEGGQLIDMPFKLIQPPHARVGDKVAVLSPSFAAPGFAPAVHEQAMRRLTETTGLVPVEYPTTRQLGASPQARAADLMAAFADPEIRAVLATVGGEDRITVMPYLDADVIRADPKPFLGYSDNTNLLPGCGPKECAATTAARRRCIWVPDRMSTPSTRHRCGLHYLKTTK